jgi:hypothetical protein
MLRALVLLLAVVALGKSQSSVLTVSTYQPCINIALEDATLNCSKTAGRVTVVNLLVEASGNTPTSGFDFQITTTPSSADQVQRNTADTCTLVGANGECSVTNRVRFFFTAERPVVRYKLTPVTGFLRNPFAVPWAYVYVQNVNTPRGIDDSSLCFFVRTYSLVGSAKTPSNKTINDIFINDRKNANCIKCTGGTAPAGVQNVCNNALAYALQCWDGQYTIDPATMSVIPLYRSAEIIAQFCELAPLCSAFTLSRRPELVGRLNITAVNTVTGQEISLSLDSIGTRSSVADPQGRLLISVVGDVTTNSYIAPSILGVIILCNQSGSIEMVPEGFRPSTNPWKLANERFGFDSSYRLPTSRNINLISGRMCDDHCGYYYITPDQAQALGMGAGKLGVDPNLYAYPPDSLYFEYYDRFSQTNQNKLLTPTLRLGDIKKVRNVYTGVPNFGANYGNIEITTPCDANGYMRANDGNKSLNNPQHMPPGYNMPSPRSWIQGNYMYMEVDTAVSYQVQIQGSVEFLGVIGTVSKAEIDPKLSACYVDNTNPTVVNASLLVRVNNVSPSNSQSSFTLATTCTGGLVAQSQVNTKTLVGGTGELVRVPVRLTAGALTEDAACTVEMYSSSALVDPRSVRMQSVTFGCIYRSSVVPIPTSLPFNITDFQVDRRPPGSDVSGDKESSQIVFYIMVSILGVLVFGGVTATVVGCVLNLASQKKLKDAGVK